MTPTTVPPGPRSSVTRPDGAADWYRRPAGATVAALGSDAERGLTTAEASARLAIHGPNELQESGLKSPLAIIWEQASAPMMLILIGAAVLAGFIGDLKDVVAILVIVVINVALGFTQEYRAEKAMAALKQMAVPLVRVRRDGEVTTVSARELVPGDIVLLEAGNIVPADGRLIESANLRIQEAALTGESEPIEKTVDPIDRDGLALGDRTNMGYMGTVVSYGRGQLLVTSTGMTTELGRIATLIKNVHAEQTPLQKRLNQVGAFLIGLVVFVVLLVLVMGLLRGESLQLMVMTSISLAVAAIPEALWAVVTISLALGAQRMLKRHALIRKLLAVETLGSTSVICSDKTGTLTENRMTVTVLDVAGDRVDIGEALRDGRPVLTVSEAAAGAGEARPRPDLQLLLVQGALCNDAVLSGSAEGGSGDLRAIGDPTEGALVVVAARFGLNKADLDAALPRVAEVPFDSERKRMTTIHAVPTGEVAVRANGWLSSLRALDTPYIAVTKGAVDGLLDISTRVWVNGAIEPLTSEWRERVAAANSSLALNGMRVLGVGFRPLASAQVDRNGHDPERDLIFVGMVGIIDPPRPEVRAAVATCIAAGIRPVMITGDHPLTAQAIARELGIVSNGATVLTGAELDRMSAADLDNVVERVSVYARVSPEHKLKIVEALQQRGHVVAMTGDGVNDAPALRKADIGVAMGITGTDVSKEAADTVLLDDNFATIVASVEEGRSVYANIRRFIRYSLTGNLGKVAVMLVAPFTGMPLPLQPIQILWMNVINDGLPGLAMSTEPPEKDAMRRPPIKKSDSLIDRAMALHIIWIGLLIGALAGGIGYYYWQAGSEDWQTKILTIIVFSQMLHALAVRSTRESLFKVGLFTNKPLLYAVLVNIALHLAVVYVPFLQNLLGTTALYPADLLICAGAAFIVFLAVEAQKWVIRRRGAV